MLGKYFVFSLLSVVGSVLLITFEHTDYEASLMYLTYTDAFVFHAILYKTLSYNAQLKTKSCMKLCLRLLNFKLTRCKTVLK